MTLSFRFPVRAALLMLALQPAFAQSHGYVYFGAGGVSTRSVTSSAMYAGAGGVGVFGPGIGIGGEAGYTSRWGGLAGGVGLASANGSFHFRRSTTVIPFVTGGYTLFFRSAGENGFNVGGGVDWWFHDRLGLKAEVRDHVGVGGFRNIHFWVVRAGLNFR